MNLFLDRRQTKGKKRHKKALLSRRDICVKKLEFPRLRKDNSANFVSGRHRGYIFTLCS